MPNVYENNSAVAYDDLYEVSKIVPPVLTGNYTMYMYNLTFDGLLPVYYAGGTSSFKPQSSEVAEDWRKRGLNSCRYLADRKAAEELVRQEAGRGDIVLVMGARDNSLSNWAQELCKKSDIRENGNE